MKIALLQNSVKPEARENIVHIKGMAEALKNEHPDLLLLPELWNTPYDNERIVRNACHASESIQAMAEIAQSLGCTVCGGSIPYPEDGKIYNRCLVFAPDGRTGTWYDKTHLMEVHTPASSYQEKDVFTPGERLCMFETPQACCGINLCYDIRFPEMARILSVHGIQLLLVPAAFNHTAGKNHWNLLMRTRALENEIFVAACNPAAYTYRKYKSYGHSLIAAPDGSVLASLDEKEGILLADLDLSAIKTVRNKMPFWNIRREDLYGD